jgi:hypothetical protein
VPNTNSTLWWLAGLLFLAVAAVAAYKVWPLLNPELSAVAPLDPACDLRAGPCTGLLPDGGKIRFGIVPREIPVIKPLKFQVDVEGIDAREVEVDLQGVDMNMGYNRPKLGKLDDGHFEGQAIIPVCVRDAMEWEARVLVRTDSGLVAAPFRFITVKPGITLPGK